MLATEPLPKVTLDAVARARRRRPLDRVRAVRLARRALRGGRSRRADHERVPAAVELGDLRLAAVGRLHRLAREVPRAHATVEVGHLVALLLEPRQGPRATRPPLRQATTTVSSRSRNGASSSTRAGSSLIGMCTAPGAWPRSHSSCSRMSRKTASSARSVGCTWGNWLMPQTLTHAPARNVRQPDGIPPTLPDASTGAPRCVRQPDGIPPTLPDVVGAASRRSVAVGLGADGVGDLLLVGAAGAQAAAWVRPAPAGALAPRPR